MSTFSATAKVQVTIEIDAGSSWGENCTAGQIRDQAGKEAVTRLMNLLDASRVRATIIGTPKVMAVMHGETKETRR